MSVKHWLAGLTLVAVSAFVTSTAMSQDEKKHDHDHGAEAHGGEMDAEMAAWMAAATPNENHQRLSYMVGTWKTDVTAMWGPEPEKSQGRTKSEWKLGKRFVGYEYQGQMMGQPFEGLGYTGYDNIKKKYVSVWMDSMGTMMFTEEGDYDASSKTFTYRGEMNSPMGEKIKTRTTIEVVSDDKHVMTFHHTMPGQPESKVMEIVYRRDGAAAKSDSADSNG